jgi:hypothetical protein
VGQQIDFSADNSDADSDADADADIDLLTQRVEQIHLS